MAPGTFIACPAEYDHRGAARFTLELEHDAVERLDRPVVHVGHETLALLHAGDQGCLQGQLILRPPCRRLGGDSRGDAADCIDPQ